MAGKIKKGDYVLATKYSDGDAGDHWCVGFYDRCDESRDCGVRHFVVDSDGKQFRGNGFRRAVKITPEQGRRLLERGQDLEDFSPSRSVYGVLREIKRELKAEGFKNGE